MLSIRLLTTPLKAAAVAILLFSSASSMAQEMTAANYIAMDLEARQITLDGARDRLTLLQRNAGLDAQLDQDADIQQAVEAVYREYGMTASSAIAWATQHSQAIANDLAESPNGQAEYDRIARELDAVSAHIQTLANQSPGENHAN